MRNLWLKVNVCIVVRLAVSYLADNKLQCPMYHSLADFLTEVANTKFKTIRSICSQGEKAIKYDTNYQEIPATKLETANKT